MIGCIKSIRETLTHRQKRQIVFLEGLFVLQGVLDVFGFSAIVAFIALMLDMENAAHNPLFQILQNMLPVSGSRNIFILISFLLLLVFGIKYTSTVLAKVFLSKFVYTQETKIVQRLYCKYIFWPYESFFEASSYNFNKKILSDARGYSRVLETSLIWFGEMVKAVITLGVLVSINWKVTLLIALGGGFAAWFYLATFAKWSRNLGEERDELYKAQIKQLNQSFTGIREIILDGKQDYHARLFARMTREYNHAEQVFSVLSDFPRVFFEAIGILGALVMIVIILLIVEQPVELLSQISVFALLIVKMLPSLQKLVSAKTVINYYEVPFATVTEELRNGNVYGYKENSTADNSPLSLEKELVIENLTYRYPSTEENALSDVCLRIPAGTFVGISGMSGSGKSTLIDVVCGLLLPTAGTVCADGYDISQDLPRWRQKVAYIPQNVFLFEDTLKHNIAPGIPDDEIDRERLLYAIRSAKLEDVVTQLPCGLDEPLGERGIRLSGGQCQRIAIARALYKEARLLILDEATSSLDTQTEQDVLKSLEELKGKITLISVAHREAALNICDERYIIEKGTVRRYEK